VLSFSKKNRASRCSRILNQLKWNPKISCSSPQGPNRLTFATKRNAAYSRTLSDDENPERWRFFI
jgi:hypothetical protein